MSVTEWEPPKLRYVASRRLEGEVWLRYIPREPRLAVKPGCTAKLVVDKSNALIPR